jgi:ribosomal protein L37AE/L43A
MTACPCCSHSMLRHIRQHQVYWFCRSCWQEMPLYNSYPRFTSSSLELELGRLARKHALAVA